MSNCAARDGLLTEDAPSPGAPIHDGNEWVQRLARLCGPGAGLRHVGTPLAEIESIFDSVFPRLPAETGGDSHAAQPSNAVQLFGTNADILDAYYIFIHPYFPILPPPEHLPVSHNPVLLEQNAFQPASPLALAVSAIVALVPHQDVKDPSRPECVNARGEVSNRFAQSAYEVVARDYELLRSTGGFEGSLRDVINRPPFHLKVPVCLEGIIALTLLSFWEYAQRGDMDSTLRRANEALAIAIRLGLHESLEENQYAESRRRAWWIAYMSVCHLATVSGTAASFNVYDPGFVTPYPKGWRLRVEAQHALYEAGIFARDLDETVRTRGDASWIPNRMAELDIQITSLLFECRDLLPSSQVPRSESVESVASNSMRAFAEVKLHSARIKLHRYCAFQDVPVVPQQPGLDPGYISPNDINAASIHKTSSPPHHPTSLQAYGLKFPFSTHTSSAICVHAAINVVTLLDSLPYPNPTRSDASANNMPYIYQNCEIPRAMPTLICCATQACYTMLTLCCQAKAFNIDSTDSGVGSPSLAGLRHELEQSLRLVAKFLTNHAIAFEAIQPLRDEVVQAVNCEFQ
ncbi:C6 finger domain protein [Aspergillus heteromorphus CBS 117.55]|uniref:C6 finger domain protein n=1 Tax=Aspergillus heteromorphus CBS 117.55 TaxID=1448321 RepID=A0A317VC75_9EURO|nr:C6 finger domain protein [Aspergillus heteromorphus CBS 117.55]PWY69500.1 C6 finger domain protein [Aspergillus heteromorphus CBS 117.55]